MSISPCGAEIVHGESSGESPTREKMYIRGCRAMILESGDILEVMFGGK